MVVTRMGVEGLVSSLPDIAREIVRAGSPLRDGQKTSFLENIDSPLEHEPMWHQWGILTHSERFLREYDGIATQDSWYIGNLRAEYVGNLQKSELLRYSAILHDLGKLYKGPKNHSGNFDFVGHESKSKEIIHENPICTLLKENGLSLPQIKYIADSAASHGTLFNLRKEIKKDKEEYAFDNVSGSSLYTHFSKMVNPSDPLLIEKGVLFMADSLAKTDFHLSANSTEEVDGQIPTVRTRLEERGLPEKLISAVLQQPTNIKLSEEYFKYIANADE